MNKLRQNGLGVEVVWHRRPTLPSSDRLLQCLGDEGNLRKTSFAQEFMYLCRIGATGSAFDLHSKGQGFESLILHQPCVHNVGQAPPVISSTVRGRDETVAAYVSPYYGKVAQQVEQRTENPRVGGSSPSFSTIYHDNSVGRVAESYPAGRQFKSVSWYQLGSHHLRSRTPKNGQRGDWQDSNQAVGAKAVEGRLW